MSTLGDALDELATGARFGRFLSVGALGAMVDLPISSALTLTALLEPQWAKVVGTECAIIVMFLINDAWTFDGQGAPGVRAKLRRLLRSNVVRSPTAWHRGHAVDARSLPAALEPPCRDIGGLRSWFGEAGRPACSWLQPDAVGLLLWTR